eukprot:Pgem_evm1s1981
MGGSNSDQSNHCNGSAQILRNANFQSNTASNTPTYLPLSTLISGQTPPTYLPLG